MMRALFRLLALAVLVIPTFARGQQPCQPLTNCRANGHHATTGSFYPFSEDIAFQQSQPINQVTVTGPSSSWTIVATGCVDVARNNLFAGAPFHTRLLAWLQIGATTVAPGGHYEVQFLVDGVPGGWFVRSYRGMLPQGDHYGTIRKDLTAGTHRFEVQVRLLAPGSMTFTQQYTTSMGTPTSFPFGGSTAAPAFTIDGLWRQVTNEVTFSNSVPIDLYPMAYLQWNSGTPNDAVRVKFMLDGVQPPRTSDIAVPPYFRDGINIFDHFKNVPPGTHRISLWARNLNNRPASVSFRTVEIASYPAASAHASNPILTEAAATDTRTIDPTIVSAEQPPFDSGGVCGYWTKILEFDIPPTFGVYNWTGEGYVRLLGNRTGNWSTTWAQMAIEATTGTGVSSDMHWVSFSPPNSRGQIYFFADSMLWGNGHGQKIKLWMRKVSGCGGTPGTFRIGARYISLKLVPTDNMSCYLN